MEADEGLFGRRDPAEIGPDHVVEDVRLQCRDGAGQRMDLDRLQRDDRWKCARRRELLCRERHQRHERATNREGSDDRPGQQRDTECTGRQQGCRQSRPSSAN